MKKAIFAGSFDPLHDGHIKIIDKAISLFDELFVVVANNDFKKDQGEPSKRLEQVKEQLGDRPVVIVSLSGKLLADFAKENEIKYLVRSARDNTDFSYELQMAKVNKSLNEQLETILIIPDYEDIELRSSNFKKINAKVRK